MAGSDTEIRKAASSFFGRIEVQILAAALALGGGGFTSHFTLASSLGSKIDAQNEKLDKIENAVSDLKTKVAVLERSISEVPASQAALIGRVTSLETKDAAHVEQLSEIQRRLHDLESKTK